MVPQEAQWVRSVADSHRNESTPPQAAFSVTKARAGASRRRGAAALGGVCRQAHQDLRARLDGLPSERRHWTVPPGDAGGDADRRQW